MNKDFIYSVTKMVYAISPALLIVIGLYGNISDDWTRATALFLGSGSMIVQYLLWGLENSISNWIVAYHYYILERERIEKESAKK